MSNITAGDVTQVIVGPARILIAPKGSALPPTNATPIAWDVAWKEVGYTDKGVDLAYAPTVKDIMVDELLSPVQKILTAEKADISAVLSQATLANLKNAISAATLSTTVPGPTQVGLTQIGVGTGTLQEVMVGIEGLSPAGFWRMIIGYRAIAQASIKMSFARTDNTKFPLDLSLLADSSKAIGHQLFDIWDMTAVHT